MVRRFSGYRLGILVGVLLTAFVVSACGEKPARRPTAGTQIICFGDSLTAGTGAARGMDYPAQLSRLVGRPVVNAAAPGDTTAEGLARLEQDVLGRSPRLVLITLGGNDLKNGVSRDAAFGNLRQIVDCIHDAGALAVIGGIDIPFYSRGFDKAYKKLAEETGAVLIENILDDIMGNRSLMSDPIPPNEAGYALMAERFHQAIEPYL
jgi:lysophospholipase L1-like esterase